MNETPATTRVEIRQTGEALSDVHIVKPNRLLSFLCIALAAVLALNSLLGPLATGVIEYRYTETFRNQAIGLDAFSLVFAVPILLAAALLAMRGRPVAQFLALGPAAMTAYMMPQYVLGAHYLEISGNNEDFFPLHLGMFVLSLAVAVVAWLETDRQAVPPSSRRRQFWTGLLMLAVAAFLLMRYLPSLVDIWRNHPGSEYLDDPVAFWLIAFMDLGIIAPAAVTCGVALLRGVRASEKLMYAVVGWFALVGPAVAAMGFAMWINDDPHASLGSAVVFTIYGGVFAALAAFLFRPLAGKPAVIARSNSVLRSTRPGDTSTKSP